MLKNRWLLALVVFIVSLVISLVFNRDIKIAISTGVIAVLANFCGVFVANGMQRIQQRRMINILEMEISELEDFESQLYDYISAMAAEQQRREINLNNLQRQLNQVYIQNAEQQRSKSLLNQELTNLQKQRQKLEAEVQKWEKQVYHLERQREELDLSLRSLAAEKHNAEVNLSVLQGEIEQLQQEFYHLNSQPKPIVEVVKTVEIVASVVEEKPPAPLPDEWIEFICQLTPSEVQVLKAIAQSENPSPIIKKIAETYITMPELLMDGINQQAIATIGDIIIEPGSNPPVIAEDEYLTKIKEILKINE